MTTENNSLTWEFWLKEGDQYLKASKPEAKSNRFGTQIVYNLLSMSLEKYIMAILDFNKSLPDNHTYTDLFNALDTVISIDSGLKNRILQYESIQSICSVDKFEINDPTEEQISDLKEALLEFKGIAHQACAA